ncbi:MAG: sigma-54 dependent transcriptional regulator [Ignavibacteriaceae bacterium]|nr:sigma-54 dependent transcriptional regulator [Ignavibacteriaceae bacterium]
MKKILIIDDDELMRETLISYLANENYSIITAINGSQGIEIIKKEKPDIVFSDIRMPNIDGLELLKTIKESNYHIPFLLMTAYDDMDSTIRAMQLGAYDYLEKPIEKGKFIFLVKRALETKELSDRLEVIDLYRDTNPDDHNILIGKSPSMKDIVKKIGRISSSRMTILVQGESGVGKEVVSRAIHSAGITKDEPFVPVNCTALADTLLESELFGHVKGSFTGATRDKKGKFELSGEGTIFLDEISEISHDIQLKLLRVIQEKEFERVGDEISIPLKSRIIVATNKDLYRLVTEGKFREDLYYRLNVFKINIPPLRERREDIPELVIDLLKKINQELHKNVFKVPYDVMELLKNNVWAGNVRELENVLQEAVALAKEDVLEKENLFMRNIENTERLSELKDMSLVEVEKKHILLVLKNVNWDKKEACKVLKISRPTLDKKIKDNNIEFPNTFITYNHV